METWRETKQRRKTEGGRMTDLTPTIQRHLNLIRMHKSCNEPEIRFIIEKYKGNDLKLFQELDKLDTAYWDADWNELFKQRGIR